MTETRFVILLITNRNNHLMKIEKNISVKELKSSFTRIYPYLNLRLYSQFHDHNEGSPKSQEVEESVLLGSLNPQLKPGEIVISDSLTVDRLETIFKTKYGLSVQVFRKSGDQWLQTTSTDKWTLERQNDRGQEYDTFLSDAV